VIFGFERRLFPPFFLGDALWRLFVEAWVFGGKKHLSSVPSLFFPLGNTGASPLSGLSGGR